MRNYDEKSLSKPVQNIVLGQYGNKVVLSSDEHPGELFFSPMTEGTATIGEHLPDATLYPIFLLSSEEESEIKEQFERKVQLNAES